MKSLAILLLLASVAWGGEYIIWEPDNVTAISHCPNGFDPVGGICKVKKGHCPHCGAKGEAFDSKWSEDIKECKRLSLPIVKKKTGFVSCTSGKNESIFLLDCEDIEKEWCGMTMYLCPNGHVFWEKGE